MAAPCTSTMFGNVFSKWTIHPHFLRWLSRKASTSTERAIRITNVDARRKRLKIFEWEQTRQLALLTRVEKIEVKYVGVPEECTLRMNKDLSTPFNCAMHIQELLMTRSALALVNGEPWDMHRPLEEDCELNFLHFADEDPQPLNNRELDCLGRIGLRLRYEGLKFERLQITAEKAEEMFADNRFKLQQIPFIAAKSKSGSTVNVYRMGDHVDMSCGPLIANTEQIGRFSVCSIHDIDSPSFGKLSRIQGLAMPTQLNIHSWTYDTILRRRATKLNVSPLPELKNHPQPSKLVES